MTFPQPARPAGRIHLSAPDAGELEEEYLVRALRSGWVAPVGPDLEAFEQEVAVRAGRRYGVALSSGSAALHLGLLACGVDRGDVVVTSTMTFAATANAITYTGAEPWFVDSEPLTGNMDPGLLDSALVELAAGGRRVGAVVPVDLLGRCADYDEICAIAALHGVPVLADAAESFGATSAGRPAGSFGEAAALSFNGNKIMTTSGGGMLVTDSQSMARFVRYLATQARQPVEHYEHTDVGYNYRLSNLLAALGRAQLRRLDGMIQRRRSRRDRYEALFAGQPGVELFQRAGDQGDNCWLTALLVDPDLAGWSGEDLSKALAAEDIECRPLWKPMHRQPVFQDCRALLTGVADRLFASGLALPSSSALTETEHERIDEAVGAFLGRRA